METVFFPAPLKFAIPSYKCCYYFLIFYSLFHVVCLAKYNSLYLTSFFFMNIAFLQEESLTGLYRAPNSSIYHWQQGLSSVAEVQLWLPTAIHQTEIRWDHSGKGFTALQLRWEERGSNSPFPLWQIVLNQKIFERSYSIFNVSAVPWMCKLQYKWQVVLLFMFL